MASTVIHAVSPRGLLYLSFKRLFNWHDFCKKLNETEKPQKSNVENWMSKKKADLFCEFCDFFRKLLMASFRIIPISLNDIERRRR